MADSAVPVGLRARVAVGASEVPAGDHKRFTTERGFVSPGYNLPGENMAIAPGTTSAITSRASALAYVNLVGPTAVMLHSAPEQSSGTYVGSPPIVRMIP